MKNFDPVGYTRDKWSDPKQTKNRHTSCYKDHHSFCNFDYEWATNPNKLLPINRPVNPSISNADLPLPTEKVISINYDSITEENLDDWIAQSMNRNLGSLLNPQKKFFIPPQYDEQLKQRYRKNKEIKKSGEDDTYFNSNRNQKKVKGYMSSERKKKVSANQLCFDYKQLQPHQEMIGTPIKIREMKKVEKKQIRRRNAIMLKNDVHYTRFLKKVNKQKMDTEGAKKEEMTAPKKTMIYSFNLESMSRNNCFEDVPNSIIEKEYERIKEPDHDFLNSHRALMDNQEKLHEKYRLLMNEKTDNAITTIKEIANPKATDTLTSFILFANNVKKAPSLNNNTKGTTLTNQSEMAKDKKYLQNKVIKLLNNMQVQSESIDPEMAKFNVHANEIFLQHPDSRPQIKWILKGQEKIKAGQNLLAIDCYKQAIILQPQLFIPVFNIAVLLEKENMLESARLWFNLASQFDTDTENVMFGISLVALKQLRYTESLYGINQLIQKIEGSGKKAQSIYYYIRALCYKQLGQFKEARADYSVFQHELKPSNYNVLSDFIFSVVYHKCRRIPLHFNCLSYMRFKENLFIILYENSKKIKEDSQSLASIADKIISLKFFRRFSLNLIKKFLTLASYEEKSKGEIIFNTTNSTSVILNGLVSLKSHQKDFIKPNMVSVLGEGGVIGAGKLEDNISAKPNNWFQTLSKVELLTVPRNEFEGFWKGQITFEKDFRYNFLKNVQLFKGLSDQTLFKLCQMFERKVFEKGAILFNDCSYNVQFVSKAGKGYGLIKNNRKTDLRFVSQYGQPISRSTSKTRVSSKLFRILKKHIFKFNEMKFNRLKYPGLFVVMKGSVELQDDRGFRVSNMINERDFFGENLVIESDGFHKYGRMVAESDELEVLMLDINDIHWLFNQQDKEKMVKNCQKRETIETIRFLRNRFNQCLEIKLKQKPNFA